MASRKRRPPWSVLDVLIAPVAIIALHHRAAKQRGKPVNKKTAARLKRIAEIRELAKTMTYAQAMAHTGICQGVLVRYAADGGFKFQPDPRRGKGNLGRKLSDPVEDRRKAEKLVAYRDAGLKRKDAVELLGISYKQLSRLLREFNLTFPTTADKKAKRKL